ncbi:MAG: hypothetical protein Aurels2KO_42690 [Aureliella sp.]
MRNDHFKWLRLAAILCTLALVVVPTVRAFQESLTVEQLTKKATKQFQERNFKDASETLKALLHHPDAKSDQLAKSLDLLGQCAGRINQQDALETEIVRLVDAHVQDPEVLLGAVQASKKYLPKQGYIADSKFARGYSRRRGGAFVNVATLDRVRSMRWLRTAIDSFDQQDPGDSSLLARLHLELAETLLGQQMAGQWRLQELTDLDQELNYDEIVNRNERMSSGGAPVKADGEPVLYIAPESWDAATNDGQRARYCLEQASKNERHAPAAQNRWAAFLESQFAVTTMQQYSWFGRIRADDNTSERLQLHTLTDDETIARLASGATRFSLPAEHNFIAIYKQLAEHPTATVAQAAMSKLHGIYLNRRQFETAASWLEKSIEKFEDRRGTKAVQLSAIRDPRIALDSLAPVLAGQESTVSAKFRNAERVKFAMQRVDVQRLLREFRQYYQAPGGRRQRHSPSMPSSLFGANQINDYLIGEATKWDERVESPKNHWDARKDFTLPATEAGLYLVEVAAQGDDDRPDEKLHRSRILVWVQKYVLTRKDGIDGAPLYYLADAKTGEPQVGNLEIFSFVRQRNNQQRSVTYRTDTRVIQTGSNGLARANLPKDTRWIVTARVGGKLAGILENENSYRQRFGNSSQPNIRKVYGLTNQPIYRPGDLVKLKGWLAETGYDEAQPQNLGGVQCKIEVLSPRNEVIYTTSVGADDLGGCDTEFRLPAGADLGRYTVNFRPKQPGGVSGNVQFLVEEFRKPEFEVLIDAPTEPARLGETITATVRAKYYFGTPVTGATAQVTVTRSVAYEDYYPITPYDWLYGPGFWWTAKRYDWLPGYGSWCGCVPILPLPSSQPDEVVLSKEVTLDARGEAKIEIDTSIAKQVFGDKDHRYKIEAEVRDASRRTIAGSASIVASVEPFKIYSWTDRGFYNVGDTIGANFQARRLDSVPVSGPGTVELRKLSYDAEGDATERVVYSAEVAVGESGELKHKIASQAPGQYRMVLRMSDAGREVEGGYVFVIRGDRPAAAEDFRFAALELTPDRKTYQPGDIMRLQVASERDGATVLLFQRSANGQHNSPTVLVLDGKSKVVDIPIRAGDHPSMFVEAMTVFDGKVHHETRNVAVPPSDKLLNVVVKADKEKYLPGKEAEITLKVTDQDGKPVVGSCMLAAYDRSLEQLAAGALPSDIREFFWKWTRTHWVNFTSSSLHQGYPTVPKGQRGMESLGAFGWNLADDNAVRFGGVRAVSFGGLGGGMGGGAPAMEMAMADALPTLGAKMARSALAAPGNAAGNAASPSVKIRKNFADSALWVATVATDANGEAREKMTMPENLTSWQVKSWCMASGVRVGSDSTQVITHKPLLVRMITPRFLTEGDKATLSTIVHNDFDTEQTIEVSLEIDGETQVQFTGETSSRSVTVAPHEQARIDWPVEALAAGDVKIRAVATCTLGSDGVEQPLSVQLYGVQRTESFAGTVRWDETSELIRFSVPENRNPEQSSLVVRASPSLAMAMVDTLPYLVHYPYGCTEQTLNRFLPSVLAYRTLTRLGVKPEDLAKARTNLNAQQLGPPGGEDPHRTNPIYDTNEIKKIVDESVRKLTNGQLPDGSWGWFSGDGARTNPHITLLTLRGLQVAREQNVPMFADMIPRGIQWVEQYVARRVGEITREEKPLDVNNLDALALLVLSREEKFNAPLQKLVLERRSRISVYSHAMLAIVAHRSGDMQQRDLLHQNIKQYLTVDEENETAYLETQAAGWYWYGSGIEADAMYLKLLSLIDPNGQTAPRLVKYLINNRRHGTYWNNTRDSALVVEALSDYIVASGENLAACGVEAFLDGKRLGRIEFTPKTFFTANATIEIKGRALTTGDHTLELRRTGSSNVYYSVYTSNFTREAVIKPAGLEVKIQRRYYRLSRDITDSTLPDRNAQPTSAKQERLTRTLLNNGDVLASGDLVEVELLVESKNDYEYLLIEDKKPAGLEAVDSQSGYFYQSRLYMYRELRERHVGLCVEWLPRGKYSVRYQLRSEGPGTFQAPPATVAGMYATELVGNSGNATVTIE